MDLRRLSDFFPPSQVEFRIGATNATKDKGIALAYITNRAIQNRLDDVCGSENWRNEFREWKGGSQLCGISINTPTNGWVTKWDGAEDSATEPIKGGLSNSMKRAAAQWGIGRYLYDIPSQWVPIVANGKSYKFKNTPVLPKQFIPSGHEKETVIADIATADEVDIVETLSVGKTLINKAQQD